MTAAQLLTDTFNETRNITRFYLSKLKEKDPLQVFTVNGFRLNSAYWLTAHLAWAEHFLLLQGTGSTVALPEFLKDYGISSNGEVPADAPDYKTILHTLNSQHEIALQHLLSLSDEALQQPNPLGITFGTSNTVKMVIQHAIRHEGTHAGHIGWLCKLHGVATL